MYRPVRSEPRIHQEMARKLGRKEPAMAKEITQDDVVDVGVEETDEVEAPEVEAADEAAEVEAGTDTGVRTDASGRALHAWEVAPKR